ncbi:hypothetical protein AbraIFM66951_010501 [Aspergillus brasiliensis]|uniref:Uncharacterized protein n=1 Tax=Aspergillus brasiliensis TaxID=319629 RepID=A0A9W5Z2M5_9EURO|nr:hypothetical protein AbraCBS73388_004499 [Aspergillus brasiliensis]GKZ47152.1 hypothetical protein AbraIFM66951_010501 [Aspergillus brasiliensis]
MSLIAGDAILMRLWEDAQVPGNERAVSRLWNHLFGKHLFSGKKWAVFRQPTPLYSLSQRIVITIEQFNRGDIETMAFGIHEPAAMDPMRQDLDRLTKHAFAACMNYLLDHPGLSRVYAFTSFGTKCRVWSLSRVDTYLVPLFGSLDWWVADSYVDLHSPEAAQIRDAVESMKNRWRTYVCG